MLGGGYIETVTLVSPTLGLSTPVAWILGEARAVRIS